MHHESLGWRIRCRLQRTAGLTLAAGVASPKADLLFCLAAMDGLHEFAQPQLLAGIVAIALLSLAAGIEVLMLGLGLRHPTRMEVAEPAVAETVGHDFYDWLYE